MRPGRIGFLIPEFPQQTHIAWWRISEGMRLSGAHVELMSTRRPGHPCPHPQLQEAASRTTYLWPPSWRDGLALLASIGRIHRAIRYVLALKGLRGRERARACAFILAAVRLRRICSEHRLDHVFVHSCADAAHVVAISRVLGGPPFSLRLGGDLEVYGSNHDAKMRGATLVVPAAKAYEQRLVHEIGLDPARVMWSWVGTDTQLFRPATTRTETENCNLITVARLNVAKGFQYIIPALGKLHEAGVRFIYRIVGAGPYEAEIRKSITDHGLAEHVELLGSQSSQIVAELLARSDLFALPTSGIGEGTPAAVCEAMSAGLPVVATDVGGITDMITNGEHGIIVPPGDSKALASALLRLMSDRPALRRMGAAARQKAVEHFDHRVVANNILDKIGSLGEHCRSQPASTGDQP